jgi:hypothetical protein
MFLNPLTDSSIDILLQSCIFFPKDSSVHPAVLLQLGGEKINPNDDRLVKSWFMRTPLSILG